MILNLPKCPLETLVHKPLSQGIFLVKNINSDEGFRRYELRWVDKLIMLPFLEGIKIFQDPLLIIDLVSFT
jgi:hypothetical protein